MKLGVLLGQDLEAMADEVQPQLQLEGITLSPIPEGSEALQWLSCNRPDFLVAQPEALQAALDNLEETALPEQLRALRAQPNLHEVRVILYGGEESIDANTQRQCEGLEHVFPLTNSADKMVSQLRAYLRLRDEVEQANETVDQLTQINTELYERNLQVEKELIATRQLQHSLLPPVIETTNTGTPDDTATETLFSLSRIHHACEQWSISGLYLPCDALGGDLYDVLSFDKESVGVTIADVSGHGVPASFVTAIYKATFYRATHQASEPNKVLEYLNNELANIVTTGHYVTALYIRLLNESRTLQVSGAGHPYPVWYRAKTQTVERLEENGTPLVWLPGMDYGLTEAPLEPGDKVLLFTDGISEMKNAQDELLGEERLEALFKEVIESGTTNILDQLMARSSDFTQGRALDDDVTLLLIEAR